MKKAILSAALALAFPAFAGSTSYDIDGAHSQVGFAVKHLMVSTVRGEFTKFAGSVVIDDDLPKSKVEATIEVGSISTREPKRDEHLKSPDFFDAAKNPSITFKSTKVEVAGEKLKITGDLSMHGVTKSVVLEGEKPTGESKDPWGNVKRGVSATTTVNRKDFGLNWNKALETGGVVVSDEVKITLDLELNKKVEAAAGKAAPAAPAKK